MRVFGEHAHPRGRARRCCSPRPRPPTTAACPGPPPDWRPRRQRRDSDRRRGGGSRRTRRTGSARSRAGAARRGSTADVSGRRRGRTSRQRPVDARVTAVGGALRHCTSRDATRRRRGRALMTCERRARRRRASASPTASASADAAYATSPPHATRRRRAPVANGREVYRVPPTATTDSPAGASWRDGDGSRRTPAARAGGDPRDRARQLRSDAAAGSRSSRGDARARTEVALLGLRRPACARSRRCSRASARSRSTAGRLPSASATASSPGPAELVTGGRRRLRTHHRMGELADEQRHLDETCAAYDVAFAALTGRGRRAASTTSPTRRSSRCAASASASTPRRAGRCTSGASTVDGETLYVGRHAVWSADNDLLVGQLARAGRRALLHRDRARAAGRAAPPAAGHRGPHGARLRRRDAGGRGRGPPDRRDRRGHHAPARRRDAPDHLDDHARPVRADQPRREGALVIQGGPGTGKTAVGLHRAAWLLYADPELTRAGVLVVGPNETFIRYIEQVLPALGEGGVEQRPIGSLIAQAARRGRRDPRTRDAEGQRADRGRAASGCCGTG